MAKDFFGREYYKKREKLTKVTFVQKSLTDEVAIEFLKFATVEYVDSLKNAIENFGIEKYKKDYDGFCDKYQCGVLENGDFVFFELMQELYGDKIAELQEDDSSEDE